MKTKYIHCWIWRDIDGSFRHAIIHRIDYGLVGTIGILSEELTSGWDATAMEQRELSRNHKQYIYAVISR